MKSDIIFLIDKLAEKLRNSKLKRREVLEPKLAELQAALSLKTMEEAMVFVPIFDHKCNDETVNISELASYFGISTLAASKFIISIEALLKRGFLERENEQFIPPKQQNFTIKEDVFEAILSGKPIKPQPKIEKLLDQFEFCDAVVNFSPENEHKGAIELQNMVQKMEKFYDNIPFVKEITEKIPRIEEREIAYMICAKYAVRPSRDIEDNELLEKVFDGRMKISRYRQLLESETTTLQTLNFVEYEMDDCGCDHIFKPTPALLTIFYGEFSSTISMPDVIDDRYKFVNRVHDLVYALPQKVPVMEEHTLQIKVEKLEKRFEQWKFIKTLKSIITDTDCRLIFYDLCYRCIENDDFSVYHLDGFFHRRVAFKHKHKLKEGVHPLQKFGLVKIENESIFDRAELLLTDKAKELFFEEDANLFIATVNDKDLMKPEKIGEKQLFFAPALQRQLNDLQHSLEEKNYQNLTARLKEKTLPTGIAVLLYGLPGTGKTESVMQIARATGRAIYHVDISQTKTCWFGESEKLIKEIFTKYRRLCERSSLKPILLFNEADAVFSKRKDANSSNVAQTENAIQNIILEELEKLDGILVATTNMANNLDAAFERRFLYKIRFDKPTLEAKKSIWSSKMPMLSVADAEYLAEKYDFSGGEIDNIVRKATVQELLTGTTPNLAVLQTLCNEEKINNASKVVGCIR